MSMGESPAPGSKFLKYSSVPGFFFQDDLNTDWRTFDFTKDFGLIDPNWPAFVESVETLNKNAGKDTKYKVLFLGRHGEGFHNVAEAFYGTEAWDCYYSLLDGNGTISWSDSHLTEKGIGQAGLASSTWATALKEGLPSPQSFYSSPLTRCMQTAYHTFTPVGSLLSPKHPFSPRIKELFRETIGVHTCDRRSTRSQITTFWDQQKKHGEEMQFYFENGFKEHDELWDKELRELPAGEDRRSVQALDDVFGTDEAVWISLSAHSGIISSLLRVLGHRPFGLTTGAVIPILVKAELINGERPPIEGDSWEKIVPCKEPPKPEALES